MPTDARWSTDRLDTNREQLGLAKERSNTCSCRAKNHQFVQQVLAPLAGSPDDPFSGMKVTSELFGKHMVIL